jgi:hypothetical protein
MLYTCNTLSLPHPKIGMSMIPPLADNGYSTTERVTGVQF